MDYKEFQEINIDYLSGNISDKKEQEFKQFLIDNPVYKEEFEQLELFWTASEERVPYPSTAMDVKFYTMLHSQKEIVEKESILSRIENFLIGSFPKQLAYTLAILTVGFFFGKSFHIPVNSSEETLQFVKTETENVRSQLVLTLLDQPSANKRLQAVNEVNKLSFITEKIIKALFSTLNNDANVNVRLSAVEALANYADIPLVREGLITSISYQKSPLVQITLANLMVVLQEKKAVKPFKKLIEQEDVNSIAKEKMEESIERII